MRRVAEPSACVGRSVFQVEPKLSEALACRTPPVALGAWSPLAFSFGRCGGGLCHSELQGLHRCATSRVLEQRYGAGKTRTSQTELSTMRRRHWLYRQAWTEKGPSSMVTCGRDAINGVGQHHVAMAGDDDLPITAAALIGQSATVIALLRFRSVPMTPNEKKKLGMALDWHLVACGCMNVLVKLFQEAYTSFEVATVIEGANSRAGPPGEVLHKTSYCRGCAAGHTSQASRDPCFFLASPRFEK